MKPRPIVAFGDSMTRGHNAPPETVWVHLMGVALKERFGAAAPDVVNAGGNGNTSAEGLTRIDADVLSHQPALVLVEFGGNDGTNDLTRHVEVPDYRANLHTIHRKVTAIGGTISLITFPPVVDRWHSLFNHPYFVPFGGLDKNLDPYREATREEAVRLGVQCFDMDAIVRAAAETRGWETLILTADGVHFTDAGNRLVADAITPFVTRLLRLR